MPTISPAKQIARLSEIFSPIAFADFCKESFQQQFAVIRGDDPTRFSYLMPWSSLNDVLRHHTLAPPRIRLMLNGAMVPSSSYIRSEKELGAFRTYAPRLREPEFTELLGCGATLVLDTVDALHEPIMLLAQRFETTFQVPINVNLYAGWRSTPGFNLHWDDHDVFILQVAGRKQWTVYGPTTLYPIEHNKQTDSQPSGIPFWSGLVTAGDLLYIPRGWWHSAVALEEPTLHLTVGLERRTGLDVAKWLINCLSSNTSMRREVPTLGDGDVRAKYIDDLRAAITSAFADQAVLEKFIRLSNVTAAARPAFALPWSALPKRLPASNSCTVRWLCPRSLEVTDLKDFGMVEIWCSGKVFTFPNSVVPLLRFLECEEAVQLDEFYRTFDESVEREQLNYLLFDLVRHGFISVGDEKLQSW